VTLDTLMTNEKVAEQLAASILSLAEEQQQSP